MPMVLGRIRQQQCSPISLPSGRRCLGVVPLSSSWSVQGLDDGNTLYHVRPWSIHFLDLTSTEGPMVCVSSAWCCYDLCSASNNSERSWVAACPSDVDGSVCLLSVSMLHSDRVREVRSDCCIRLGQCEACNFILRSMLAKSELHCPRCVDHIFAVLCWFGLMPPQLASWSLSRRS